MQNQPQVEIRWRPTPKQYAALQYLHDQKTTEIGFGGGAGGGKTELMCSWNVANALTYPDGRGLMARAVLKDFKQSTLLTLFNVCKRWNLKSKRDFTYNGQQDTMIFHQTGATLFFKEIGWQPSDPEYDRLGSTEYTWASIDEAQQVMEKAKNTINTRIRWKLTEYNLLPKLLMGFNPTKNFLYSEFYKPWKEGKLPDHRAFIQALVTDNPHASQEYIKNLLRQDPATIQRLYYGNWEYDDDPSVLMDYEAIVDLFTNVLEESADKFLTADIARLGPDLTVIFYWEGMTVKEVWIYKKQKTNETAKQLIKIITDKAVPRSKVIVDEDGIGGGVMDQVEGIKGFVANSSPFNDENYSNLKAQVHYKMSEMVNSRQVAVPLNKIHLGEGVKLSALEVRQMLTQELEQIKRRDADKDGKLKLIPKEVIKKIIGRSPDFSDTLMMRGYFEFAGSGPRVRVI